MYSKALRCASVSRLPGFPQRVGTAAACVNGGVRHFGVVKTGIDPKTRPLSPHVTIYAFPIAALASVTHRITGVLMTVGVYTIGGTELLGGDVVGLVNMLADTTGVCALSKFSVAFCVSYHTLLGTRHLYWERFPEGLEIPIQEKLSWGIFGAAGTIGLMSTLI